jgi:hypothetical protein
MKLEFSTMLAMMLFSVISVISVVRLPIKFAKEPRYQFGGIMNLHKEEQGSITIVALLILVVLTILGIALSRTTTLDLRIGTNELVRKQNFYVAEGGVYREAAEVGEGSSYVVANINQPYKVAAQVSGNVSETGVFNSFGTKTGPLPGASHQIPVVSGTPYDFQVDYVGFYLPPKGYSVDQFSRYDFDIDADVNNVNVNARFYRIGPKAK